jgi:hypothetical protein
VLLLVQISASRAEETNCPKATADENKLATNKITGDCNQTKTHCKWTWGTYTATSDYVDGDVTVRFPATRTRTIRWRIRIDDVNTYQTGAHLVQPGKACNVLLFHGNVKDFEMW